MTLFHLGGTGPDHRMSDPHFVSSAPPFCVLGPALTSPRTLTRLHHPPLQSPCDRDQQPTLGSRPCPWPLPLPPRAICLFSTKPESRLTVIVQVEAPTTVEIAREARGLSARDLAVDNSAPRAVIKSQFVARALHKVRHSRSDDTAGLHYPATAFNWCWWSVEVEA